MGSTFMEALKSAQQKPATIHGMTTANPAGLSNMSIGGGPGGISPPGNIAPSLVAGGKVDTSLGTMLTNAVQGNENLAQNHQGIFGALFGGNAPTGENAMNSLASALSNGLVGALGFAPANLFSMGLGQLAQFATNRGELGQSTDGSMGLTGGQINAALGLADGSGPNVANSIAQGLGLTGGQLASLNFALNAPEIAPDITQNMDMLGNMEVEGGTGTGSASGSEDRGGLIGAKRFPKSADGKHVQVKALNSEFVVNPQATRDHMAELKRINADEPSGRHLQEVASRMTSRKLKK